MKKRLLSFILACSMVFNSSIPILANSEEENYIEKNEIEKTEQEKNSLDSEEKTQLESNEMEAVENEIKAGESFTEGVLTYKISEDGKSCSIVSCEKEASGSLNIPESIDGITVNKIEEMAFAYCKNLTDIYIPEGITEIECEAFENCYNLKKINIPSNITEIKRGLLSDCVNLESITLPEKLRIIESSAFTRCENLQKMIVPESVTEIKSGAFSACSNLTEITLPEGLTMISEELFLGCTSLKSVKIPSTVTEMGHSVFSYCSSLTEITIPSRIEKIDIDTFFECVNLTSITIPKSVKVINGSAFEGCQNLKTVNYSGTKKEREKIEIGITNEFLENAIWNYENEIKSGMCGENVTWKLEDNGELVIEGSGDMFDYSLQTMPWKECADEITTLTIGENITYLGKYSFSGCKNVNIINFNAIAMKDLPKFNDVYNRSSNAKGITVFIGDKVTRIPAYAFYYYSQNEGDNLNIKEVIFKEDSACKSIGKYAFAYNEEMENINLPGSVTLIESYAFECCFELLIQFKTQKLPLNLEKHWNGDAAICLNPEKFGVTDYGQRYWVTTDKTVYVWKYDGESNIVEIPNEIENMPVVGIASSSFYAERNLLSITIPENITYIGESAFEACIKLSELYYKAKKVEDLEESNCTFYQTGKLSINGLNVKFGKNVERIPAYLFYPYHSTSNNDIEYSPQIKEIIFDDESKCKSIGKFAFRTNEIAEIEIPDGIESIEEYAFAECENLKKVVIPETVKFIDKHAFTECKNIKTAGPENGGYDFEFGWKKSIPSYAFSCCGNWFDTKSYIEKVTLPNSIEQIGDYAFECTQISTLTLPNGVMSIGKRAFKDCKNLKELTIPKSVSNMGGEVFINCPLLVSAGSIDTESTLKFGWTEKIPDSAFDNASYLNEIKLPNSIKEIGNSAFKNCSAITSIILPNKLEIIGNESFYNCNQIKEINLPSTLVSIGADAFNRCKLVKSVNIPKGISIIRENTFRECALKEMFIPENVTIIEKNAFSITPIRKIMIPKNLKEIGNGNFENTETVYYQGAQADKDNIKLPNSILNNKNITWYYNTYSVNGFEGLDDIKSNGGVRFFRKWDDNTQTAYFDNDFLGSKVVLETDTSFINEVDNLVGKYVLVKTKNREDGMIDSDSLISIKLVDSHYGIVTKLTDENVQINDVKYPLGKDNEELIGIFGEGKKVLFHLYEGKVVGGELLKVEKGTLSYWNSKTNKIEIGKELILSNLAPQKAKEFLGETGYVDIGVKYWIDSMGYLYDIEKYVPGENSPYYEVIQNKSDEEKLLIQYANDWLEAYDQYIEAMKKEFNKTANEEDGKREAIIHQEAQRMINEDKKSKDSKYITGELPEKCKTEAYLALATLLYDEANKNFDFSSIDFSSEMAGNALVKAVMKSLKGVTRKYDYENVKINIDITLAGNSKFGSLTYEIKNTNQSGTVIICSTQKECQETMNAYLNELKNTASSAAYNIYSCICTDILGKPLSSLTSDYLEKQVKSMERRMAITLNEKLGVVGVGNLIDDLNECYSYYKLMVKPVTSSNIDDLESALSVAGKFKFEYKTIENAAVKKAMKRLNKTFVKLNEASADYLGGKLKVDSVKKNISAIFNCPVSISILNSKGEKIGYVGEDDIWYTDAILISTNGGSKKVTSLTDDLLTYEIEATDYGTMSCSFEQYDSKNNPIGRLNYYDVLLNPQKKYSITMTNNIKQDAEKIALVSEQEKIVANEFISSDQDASVNIKGNPIANDETEGGSISGVGSYVRGDKVVLVANADEGYQFLGWYEEEQLISNDNCYRFTAIQDRNLSAKFYKDNNVYINLVKVGRGNVIGNARYAVGEKATVLAIPDSNTEFIGWYVDDELVSEQMEYEFLVEKDIILTAKFKENQGKIEISLDKSELMLKVGESSERLNVLFGTDDKEQLKDVKWRSLNENIATVTDGVVIAKAVGSTEILATVGESTATCKVTVKESDTLINSISIRKLIKQLKVGETAQLEIIDEAGNVLQDANTIWKSSNEEVATVSGGLVKAVKKGKTIISVSIGDMKASYELNVIEEKKMDQSISKNNETEINKTPQIIQKNNDKAINKNVKKEEKENCSINENKKQNNSIKSADNADTNDTNNISTNIFMIIISLIILYVSKLTKKSRNGIYK